MTTFMVVLGCFSMACLGYVAWELHRARNVGDPGDVAAVYSRARTEWERHCDEALAVAGEPPTTVFGDTLRSMPLTVSTLAVLELLLAGRVLVDEIEDHLAEMESDA